jgi:UDP-N-acetylglucosamine 2-epimerase (non-hydrolysing)
VTPAARVRCDLIVGARPNFVKAAPVARQLLAAADRWAPRLVHTGQHYDINLSGLFFDQLGIRPDLNLEVGSGTHAVQTARIMVALDAAFDADAPALVIVFGDVNSTVAAALVAAKRGIAVAHVEAGLRSFDRAMPEEVNRIVTDSLSDLLFLTEASAQEHLRAEGVDRAKMHFVGNTMIDTLLRHVGEVRDRRVWAERGLEHKDYIVVTLHRPSNVDDPERLDAIVGAVVRLSRETPVVFPVHPRTRRRLEERGHWSALERTPGLRLADPLGYFEFIGLVDGARAVLTDSGGIQEEALVLEVPCVTLRTTTERPVTISCGGNVLVGDDPEAGLAALRAIVRDGGDRPSSSRPHGWDGRAAERILAVLDEWSLRRGDSLPAAR